MLRTPIAPDLELFPEVFRPLLADCAVFDSSCSKTARVYFLDKDGGLFLKSAPKGELKLEGEMDAYFHSLGLGPEVLAYQQEDRDWLLTRQIRGRDCLEPEYLADPKRLTETAAEILWNLQQTDPIDSPVKNHTARYLETAKRNYREGRYDASLFPDNWGYATAEEAWAVIQERAQFLKTDTLLHGDYCLPNILLDDWQHSGFIDLGRGGVGDKHVDLFWGAWTMGFNLKDDKWSERFLDAYGRNHFEPEMLRLIAACEVFL